MPIFFPIITNSRISYCEIPNDIEVNQRLMFAHFQTSYCCKRTSVAEAQADQALGHSQRQEDQVFDGQNHKKS